jgi:probable selenium-dependent hydroxylase accessory protein YqeC
LWTVVKDLVSAIPLRRRELISLVGGGGKSTLLFALAEDLRLAGHSVITSTTTKIRHSEALRAPLAVYRRSEPRWREKLREGLGRKKHLFMGEAFLESGKVEGIDLHFADSLFQEGEADYLIVEADGAAGKPVKVPAPHEPVIPKLTTMTIAVMGLEALGRPFSSDLVFREELFQEMTGLTQGATLTPHSLSKVFFDERGLFKGTPPPASRVVFLNKADLLPRERAVEFGDLLLSTRGTSFQRVAIASLMNNEYLVTE